MALYLVFLFVVLTPGVLLSIPPKGSKLVVATVHGIVFAIVLCLTYNLVSNATYVEHFRNKSCPTAVKNYYRGKSDMAKLQSQKPPNFTSIRQHSSKMESLIQNLKDTCPIDIVNSTLA